MGVALLHSLQLTIKYASGLAMRDGFDRIGLTIIH